ncbi:uncharacterized protein DAT39_015494, partial [Clarias magur]
MQEARLRWYSMDMSCTVAVMALHLSPDGRPNKRRLKEDMNLANITPDDGLDQK